MGNTNVQVRKDNVALDNPHGITVCCVKLAGNVAVAVPALSTYGIALKKRNPHYDPIRRDAILNIEHPTRSDWDEYYKVESRDEVVCYVDPCLRDYSRGPCLDILSVGDAIARTKLIATELRLPWRVDLPKE